MRAIESVVVAAENPVLINQVSNILMQHDYSIIIEKSAIKSIRKILEQEIDILILDLDSRNNSNMDLINVIRRMRPRLPIIVLSEDDSIATVRELAQAGVFYCALKPIQISEIEKVLKALEKVIKKDKMEELV